MTAPGESLLEAYLTHLTVERRLAANTVEGYGRDLALLAEFSAGRGKPIESLDRADLEGLVRDLMSEGRSPRSVARAIACFRGLYRFLVIDGRANGARSLFLMRATARIHAPQITISIVETKIFAITIF